MAMVKPTCRHVDILRLDMKAASTAPGGATFGSLEERRASTLRACTGSDAKVPEKGAGLTITKEVDLRIVDDDDCASHSARAIECRENVPPGEVKPMWPRRGMAAGIRVVV